MALSGEDERFVEVWDAHTEEKSLHAAETDGGDVLFVEVSPLPAGLLVKPSRGRHGGPQGGKLVPTLAITRLEISVRSLVRNSPLL